MTFIVLVMHDGLKAIENARKQTQKLTSLDSNDLG